LYLVSSTPEQASRSQEFVMSRRKFASTAEMRVIAASVRSTTPIVVVGDPGQGKTAKLEAYMGVWLKHLETVVGSVRESSDYLGLPVEIDGEVVYSPPAWAKRLNGCDRKKFVNGSALLLDELTTAAPSVQKASLRILQERWVGEYELDDDVAIIAAMNPAETAVDGWELPPPVANRLLHLNWHFDVEEWLDGVGDNFASSKTYSLEELLGAYDPVNLARSYALVTSFLRARGKDFLAPPVPDNPTKSSGAWPSPRSWTNVIKVLSHLNPGDEDAATLVVKGCVGEDMCVEFIAWAADQDLPNPADVLENPSIVDWSARPDKLFAVVSAVSHLAISRGDTDTWLQAVTVMEVCAENDRPDVALPSMRNLVAKMPKDALLPSTARNHFSDLFEKAGILTAAA
jgi:hypothetical protein